MCKKGTKAASPQHSRQHDDFYYCQIRTLPNKMFTSLRNIQVLDLSDNLISTMEGEALKSVTSLRYLDLSRNPMQSLHAGFLCDASALEILLIQGTHFHDFPIHIFDCTVKLKNLSYLDFSDSLMHSIPHNAFKNIPNIKLLNLTSNNINNSLIQRDAFVGLRKLLTIDFTENDLTLIPETLCEHAPEVQYLHMAENRLKSFNFQSIDSCSHLMFLDLSHNDIVNLFGEISNPSTLQILKVSKNFIKTLPMSGFLRGAGNLTALDLSMNTLYFITQNAFHGLFSLRKLDISNNMLKNSSTPLFGSLRSLEELDLSVNNYIKIRSGFFDGLHNLTVLNLSRNDLELLEDRAFDGMTNLQVLDLRHNFLATFQDRVFSTTTNLKTLLLSQNKILSLDNVIFPKSLITLNVDENRLEHFPASFSNTNVQEVNLDSNEITTLPITPAMNFSQITSLTMSHNRIKTFSEHFFQTFANLKHLNLSNNHLMLNLSRGFFSGAISIVTLDLSDNLIQEINGMFATFESLENLRELILSYNPINRIHNLIPLLLDTNAFREASLRQIYLSSCNISFVSDEAFDGFPSLTLVDLSHNQFTEIKPLKTGSANPIFNLSGNVFECLCGMRWLTEPEVEYGDQWIPTNRYHVDDCVVLPENYSMRIKEVPKMDFLCTTRDSCPEKCQCLGISETSNTTVTKCSDIDEIPEGIPMTSMRIYLDGNRLRNLTFTSAFEGEFQTEELYVNGSAVQILTRDFFQRFKKLKKLVLTENKIDHLPEDVFSDLLDLEELHLRNNSLQVFDSEFFPESSKLMLLDISHNEITYLESELLGMIIERKHLRRIYIGNNAFICNCQNQALRNWIDEHRSRIFDRNSVFCENNREMILVSPKYFTCARASFVQSSNQKGLVLTAIILVCAMLLALATCLYFRRDILAVLGTKLTLNCLRHHYEEHKVYDVYLMYDFNDAKGSDWSNRELIPMLYQLGFKVSTPDSQDHVNNILEADVENTKVQDSKCALFVVTKHAGNNQYYMNSFRIAEKHAREQGKFKIIIVVVGDIDYSILEPEIRKLMSSGDYITARSRCAWERLTYELPERRFRLEPFSEDSEVGVSDTDIIIFNANKERRRSGYENFEEVH